MQLYTDGARLPSLGPVLKISQLHPVPHKGYVLVQREFILVGTAEAAPPSCLAHWPVGCPMQFTEPSAFLSHSSSIVGKFLCVFRSLLETPFCCLHVLNHPYFCIILPLKITRLSDEEEGGILVSGAAL